MATPNISINSFMDNFYIDRENPQKSFDLFDFKMESLDITDDKTKFLYFIKMCDDEITDVILEIIKSPIKGPTEKLNECKDIITGFLNKKAEDIRAQFFNIEKKPDSSYSEFLRKLKQLGSSSGQNLEAISSRFYANIKDNYKNDMANMLKLQKTSIEDIATYLDKMCSNENKYICSAKNTKMPETNNKRSLAIEVEDLQATIERKNRELSKLEEQMKYKLEMQERRFNEKLERINQNRNSHQGYHYNNDRNGRVRDQRPTYSGNDNWRNRNYENKNAYYNNYRGKSGNNSNYSNYRPRYETKPDDICFYHSKFGANAYKCDKPCNYQKNEEACKRID